MSQKEREKALRDCEEKYRQIFKTMALRVAYQIADGKISQETDTHSLCVNTNLYYI